MDIIRNTNRNRIRITSTFWRNRYITIMHRYQRRMSEFEMNLGIIFYFPALKRYTFPCSFSASLSLEELLPFIDDPWWQKLRRTLFCTFCLVFWLILFTGCTLAYMERNKQCVISIASATTPTNTSTMAAATLQRI